MNPPAEDGLQIFQGLMDSAAARAAAAFAEMLALPVSVQFSKAELVAGPQIDAQAAPLASAWSAGVHIHFEGAAQGEALFLLPEGNDAALVDALLEQNPFLKDEPDPARTVIMEIGNVLLNACTGTIANHFGWQIIYQAPELLTRPGLAALVAAEPDSASLLRLMSSLGVGGLEIQAIILMLFPQASLLAA